MFQNLTHTALGRILAQVTIYHRLRIGRDGHLDQSKVYGILTCSMWINFSADTYENNNVYSFIFLADLIWRH